MDRLSKSRYLFGLAVVLMPASYAVKHLLGFLDVTWVNPTLLLGVAAFLLWGYRAREGWTGCLTAYAFLVALIGSFYLPPAFDRPTTAEYVIYKEPVRLALNLAWFWVCIEYWRHSRKLALRWLAIAVTLQFAAATYLYLAMLDWLPAPDLARSYLEVYKTRQAVWFGDVPIYRMAGTFFESPPFGLFMLCCFVVLALELMAPEEPHDRRLQRWIKLGAALSLIGSIASLSDQVLLALVILGAALLSQRMRQSKRAQAFVWAALAVTVGLYVGMQLIAKWKISASAGQDVYGQSIGERLYHFTYSLHIFTEEPASLITGIGAGRYGDYVARTGIFPSTVAPGMTPVEWMVEYGLVGCMLIGGWLWGIARKARSRFGFLGTAAVATLLAANMFQVNWKLESWFLALAFLYAGTPDESLAPVSRLAVADVPRTSIQAVPTSG